MEEEHVETGVEQKNASMTHVAVHVIKLLVLLLLLLKPLMRKKTLVNGLGWIQVQMVDGSLEDHDSQILHELGRQRDQYVVHLLLT